GRVGGGGGASGRLIKEYGVSVEGIFGQNGLVKALTGRVGEKVLAAELTHRLGYAKGEKPVEGDGNWRNGSTRKGLISESGPMEIEVPRDRAGSFERVLVKAAAAIERVG